MYLYKPHRTDFIFHAIDRSSGEIIDFDTFIARSNVDELISILSSLRICTPERITVRLVTSCL